MPHPAAARSAFGRVRVVLVVVASLAALATFLVAWLVITLVRP